MTNKIMNKNTLKLSKLNKFEKEIHKKQKLMINWTNDNEVKERGITKNIFFLFLINLG